MSARVIVSPRYAHFLCTREVSQSYMVFTGDHCNNTTRQVREMEVIDAHMHLWTPETHPWLLDVKDGGHPAGKFGMPLLNEFYIASDIHYG